MTEHDQTIANHVSSSLNLQNRSFSESLHEIREQLMRNKETIERYNSWQKHADFDAHNLVELVAVQEKLELYFKARWDYKITTPHDMLKFDKVYTSQAFIIVESHGGGRFYHIYKRYFMFQDNGFCNVTMAKVDRSMVETIERIRSMKTNYRNTFTVDQNRLINIKTREYEFEGTVIHDAIVGKEFGSGRFMDGIIETKFEILVPVN